MFHEKMSAGIQNFTGEDILSIDQFSRPDLDNLFSITDKIIDDQNAFTDHLSGKLLTNLFYEPSTRTYASFDAAMKRLGGQVTPLVEVEYSSVAKGESFEDTIMTLSLYADAIVLRHPEIGAAKRASKISDVPIINAGDGTGEHPTQALLDAYTIQSEQGSIDGKTVTLAGDLKHGRTVHSLARLLTNYQDVTINYVSPDTLKMPKEILDEISEKSTASQYEYEDLAEATASCDVLYMTRVQRERFQNPSSIRAIKNSFTVTPAFMKNAPEHMTLMHPLPRVGEINTEVDSDPRAAYFRQVKNGMFVRMALLLNILED